MTDNEIIKALENEIHLAEYVDSDYCNSTEVSLIKSTLDLINRQKAEIEKWQGGYMTQKQEIANLEIEFKAMRGAANSYKAEVERLQKNCLHTEVCCKNCTHLERDFTGALTHRCSLGHKAFLPFAWEESIEAYSCKAFEPFKTYANTENVELQHRINELQHRIVELKADISWNRVEKENLRCVIADLSVNTEKVKAEAIKEFAERLKERASKGFWESDAYIGTEQIDDLVKEMVGDNDEIKR